MRVQKEINLNNITKVKEFVNIAQQIVRDVTVESMNVESIKKYSVDGKSILGIFSLDLSKPVLVICETVEDLNKFSELFGDN